MIITTDIFFFPSSFYVTYNKFCEILFLDEERKKEKKLDKNSKEKRQVRKLLSRIQEIFLCRYTWCARMLGTPCASANSRKMIMTEISSLLLVRNEFRQRENAWKREFRVSIHNFNGSISNNEHLFPLNCA